MGYCAAAAERDLMIEWSMSMFSGGNIEAMVSLESVFATLFLAVGIVLFFY